MYKRQLYNIVDQIFVGNGVGYLGNAATGVIFPYELPIELIVGIIGSVLFVALLLYRLSHGRKAIRLNRKEGGVA